MIVTQIPNPTLVVDFSHWNPIIKPQELIDGGVTDVILKIGGGIAEDDMFRKNGELVAKTGLRLHGYWWDDPIYSSMNQVALCMKIKKDLGLPVLSIWADMEQWWSNWDKYYQAVWKKIPWSQVPGFTQAALSSHMQSFSNSLKTAFPESGIYTGRGFITSYAPMARYWLGNCWIWYAAWGRQPGTKTKMTWQELKSKWMPDYPLNIMDTGIIAANVKGHQFTGDVCQLPGSYQNIFGTRSEFDVSVFRSEFMVERTKVPAGFPPDVDVWKQPDPPVVYQTKEYIFLGSFLWVRSLPQDSCKLVDSLTHDQRVTVTEIQGDYARIETPAGWVRLEWLTKV